MAVRRWGAETVVNVNVVGDKQSSDVAVLADGTYVVSWSDGDASADGSGACIKFRQFAADGSPLGGEILANTITANSQTSPSIHGLSNGGFALAWGSVTDIGLRRFDASGSPVDASDRTELALANGQFFPDLAAVGDGYAVAYQDNTGGSQNIMLQFFQASGDVAGSVIAVANTANTEASPAIAVDQSANLLVAWDNDSTGRIQIRGFGAGGAQNFGTLDISDPASTTPQNVDVIALTGGRFLVAWTSNPGLEPDVSGSSLRARVVTATGILIGPEIAINGTTAGPQKFARLAALTDGGFVAIYESDSDLRGQVFDSHGNARGAEFMVNAFTPNIQSQASVAALKDGRFVVTWSSADDGSDKSIHMQVFDPRDGVVYGTASGEALFGHDLVNDEINGLGGADTLNGLGGADVLYGGEGDDTYLFGAGDTIVEFVNCGIDEVRSAASFTLGANLENLVLTGSAAINGTGNAASNTITGNGAANILNGGADAVTDLLVGSGGNDVYVLGATVNDVVQEAAGASGGIDTVTSTVSRSLAVGGLVNVENLSLLGTAANGTGNSLVNRIVGNAAVNLLDGGAGRDTLIGGLGNDTYVADVANEIISEASNGGIDTVRYSGAGPFALPANVERLVLTSTTASVNATGNGLANNLIGNAKANVLKGMAGNDILSGGLGNDTFVFNTAPNSSANRDAIDFKNVSGDNDSIQLDNAVFARLGGNGALNPAFFKLGAAAADANDFIVYNRTTGALFYDLNGNAPGGAIQFATLVNKPVLGAADFVVI